MKRKNKLQYYYFIMALILIVFTNCKNNSKLNGFTLQRFEIIDTSLKSVIRGIQDSVYIKNTSEFDKNVIIVVLGVYDSIPEFSFASDVRDQISKMYIYQQNRRIVGYIENGKTPLIILSDEQNLYNFERVFYKFLIPKFDKKYFEYVYFPDDQYKVSEDGFPQPPPLFDPYYYCFAYKDGKMVYMNYYNTAVTDTVLDVSN